MLPSSFHQPPIFRIRSFTGHSSHVQNVRFSPDDARVISAGSHDRAVFQWRTHAIRRNANGTIASDPDPLCTEEDCAACGTRPAPPPPPRVWGALDDSGLHFGWVRNDGTERWSRRTSTLVEEEDTESEVGGDQEGDDQAESGIASGNFASRDRLALEQGPGRAAKQEEKGVQEAGEKSWGGRKRIDAGEHYGERDGGGKAASRDRLAPEQSPGQNVKPERGAQQVLEKTGLGNQDESWAEREEDADEQSGGRSVSRDRLGPDRDPVDVPKQERRRVQQVEENTGDPYRDERRFEQQEDAGGHAEEDVVTGNFASRERLAQGQVPGQLAKQGTGGAQQTVGKAGGDYRDERRVQQREEGDVNAIGGDVLSRERSGPGQGAGQAAKQQRGGVLQAGGENGGAYRNEVRVAPQEDVERMIQRNDPAVVYSGTDGTRDGRKAGVVQDDRSSGAVNSGYSQAGRSARPVESEQDWSRGPQKEGFGRDGSSEGPGNAYPETGNAGRLAKGRQAIDEKMWASDQDTRSRPQGGPPRDSGGYVPANTKSAGGPTSAPAYPREDDSRSRLGGESTGNDWQRRQAPNDNGRDPPPADANRANAPQPGSTVPRPVDSRNANRAPEPAQPQNLNSPPSGPRLYQPAAMSPGPTSPYADGNRGASQASPGQQQYNAPQSRQRPGDPLPGGRGAEQRNGNGAPQRRPVEQSFEVHDEMLDWGGEEVDEEIEEV